MLKRKNSRITLERYFQLTKPRYVYLKIIPDKSIRNYNSCNIAKAIKHTYKAIIKQIKIEERKIWVETSFKVSYLIDIKDKNASFYFLVPECFLPVLQEKVREIWSKATISLEEKIDEHTKNVECYQVSYKKEDALSLNVDRKSNEPLNSILSVMDIMKDDDRITIIYNFIPRNNFGWDKQYKDTMEKVRLKQPLDKEKFNLKYALKNSLSLLVMVLDCVMESIAEILGANINKNNNTVSFTEALATALSNDEELSLATKKKKTASILDAQIAVLTDSVDKTRKENNAISVCHSFSVLDEKGGNELISKKVDKKFQLTDYRFSNIESNNLSCEECSNFIQIPGRALLRSFNINHIKVNECKVPEQLRKGNKYLGEVSFKGSKVNSYLENDWNIGNLPLVMIGGQGAGKSTLFGNYAKNCSDANEGLIVLDFIKGCELSETIKEYVDSSKLIELDMAQSETIQGLGYNEIIIKDNMNSFNKMKLANLQAQQVLSLIDAVSVGDPLSSRMRRFLTAAANVVFVQGYNSIKNVVECLEYHTKRMAYINSLDEELRELLEDELNTLNELNEYTKVGKKDAEAGVVPEVIGTFTSKVEHIFDRIGMLREDFKLKYMYNKSLEDNINLVECMNEGKVVLIKMKEGDFPTKMAKNILITYWISKIWLASQLRGMIKENPNRVNILIDEVFQAPTSLKSLEYILPQSRKFACKFIFSTQYIRQLDSIFDTLEASNSSYMLLRGCLEDDFNHFKSKLEEFDFEDLRDMKKFHSLNLIYYSGGYASFISKLPKPL